MKGVILAGGTGSRLYPLTRVTNKHLLPVYDKPMLYYPLQTLVDAGIMDILIVTGGNNAGDFLRLLRNGKDFGLKQLSFAYQEGEGGIADALRLAEPFAAGEKICVILGDNILENSIQSSKERFERQEEGGLVLLKKVPDPERFGVPVFEGKRIVKIEEKPKLASSPYAIIGVYFYDGTVFDRVRPLRPSGRGELEITDVNNSYLREGKLDYEIIEGGWTDAGTFESLWRATKMMREKALLGEELALAAASRKQLFVSPSQSDQKPVPQRTNGGLHGR
ncbi:MAG TPA: sugar phosphate nucleotidyltransferase [Candidatus Acidoferrum sp.]|nr:sugar phosphate nucleotidyltransferase [Candidatus Acidoferrum sp.]